jgi:mono/diheme cytochrome c family protein
MPFARILMMMMVVAGATVPLAAQQPQPGPYTQEQAVAGQAVYRTHCASCHGDDLSGGQGPQLAGAAFAAQWGDRTAGALVTYLQSNMPPGGAGLPSNAYVELVAYMLDANGARAGNQVLTPVSGAAIGDVASGERAAYLTSGPQAQGPGTPQEPPGITVAGEVETFVPDATTPPVPSAPSTRSIKTTSRTCSSRGAGRSKTRTSSATLPRPSFMTACSM